MNEALKNAAAGLIAIAQAAEWEEVLADIHARANTIIKGPEYAAWYHHDVPILLEEIDRLRYMLGAALRGD